MDRLPFEVLTMIVESVAGDAYYAPRDFRTPKLAPLASLNKTWAAVVEPFTFCVLNLNRSRLAQLGRIAMGHRCSYVDVLRYDVVLDTYSDEACAHYETNAEKARNDLIFTESIVHLLNRLSSWLVSTTVSGNPFGIILSIDAWSPSDIAFCSIERKLQRYNYERQQQEGNIDIHDARHERSALRFDANKLSPSLILRGVTRLDFAEHDTSRKVAAKSVADVASRFPDLVDLTARIFENEKIDHRTRRCERNQFARHLDVLPKGLEKVSLDFGTEPPLDQTFQLPSMADTYDESPVLKDAMAIKLGQFSQSLIKLDLKNVVLNADDFFAVATETCWPHLRVMKLNFTNITASGQWYYDFPPNVDPEDFVDPTFGWHVMPGLESDLPPTMDLDRVAGRFVPNRELFSTLYLSAAKAARHMPYLEHMRITMGSTFDTLDDKFEGVHYFLYDYLENRQPRSTASWSCNPAFTPEDAVIEAWKQVAAEANEVTCLSIKECNSKDLKKSRLIAEY